VLEPELGILDAADGEVALDRIPQTATVIPQAEDNLVVAALGQLEGPAR
jgi:hypothetical protein